MKRFIPILAALAATVATTPVQAQQMGETDMLRFLVQAQCIDASGRLLTATPVDPGCERRRPQRASDIASYTKSDWPNTGDTSAAVTGYQISDSVLTIPPRWPGGPITVAQTFDFGQNGTFGAYDAAIGDGGQLAVLADGQASLFVTQDANGLQWFMSDGCATGQRPREQAWVLFNADAGPEWRDEVANLAITHSRSECPTGFSHAYTRYIRAQVSLPFARKGQPIGQRNLDTVVSEHYDMPTIAQSYSLERFYLARDLGMVRWERWERPRQGDTATVEAAARYKATGRCGPVDYSTSPGPGWLWIECRTWTNFLHPAPGWTVRDFQWPTLMAPADENSAGPQSSLSRP